MKKMYFLTVMIIIVLTCGFLFFFYDVDTVNKLFLSKYNIEVEENPYSVEEIEIPDEFDAFYKDYNFLQIESGLNLSEFKGKKAIKYSYQITNFPEDIGNNAVYANVITVNSKPVAGDINCPSLSGFILPLSYLSSYK